MIKQPFLLTALCFSLALQTISFAATVPAGTPLTVRTIDVISSHAKTGRTFKARVDQDVVVQGKVVIPSGTIAIGVIEASRGNIHSSQPLTVNLTGLSLQGRTVSVKTTGAVQPQAKFKTARQARSGATVGESYFAAGTRLEFRLAQALNF